MSAIIHRLARARVLAAAARAACVRGALGGPALLLRGSRPGLFACALAVSSLTMGGAGRAGEPVVRWEGRTMGSPYTVQIVGASLAPGEIDALKADVDRRLVEINRQMSHYQPDSELSRFASAPARTPFPVSADFARVTRFSLDMHRLSAGAFDPTLGPVINLWGFGEKTEQRAVPPESELRAALEKTGARHLSVTARDELVKDIPDLAVNLSAVAKGFGVDEVARLLRGRGFTNLYVSIAGEVLTQGRNPRGTNWQVGISAPLAHWRETDPMAAVVSISGLSLSTSGDYQKFFTDARGRRLCHIIDPRTGWPVQNNIGGVTVVTTNSMTADALATTLFVLGTDAGLKLIEGWTNTAALFIVHEPDGQFRQIPSSRFGDLTGYRPLEVPPSGR